MTADETSIGLCARCRHHRLQRASRSVFHRCARAADDSRFPKYPPLPVFICPGFEEEDEGSGAEE